MTLQFHIPPSSSNVYTVTVLQSVQPSLSLLMGCFFSKKRSQVSSSNIEKQKEMNTKSSKDGGSSHAVPRIFKFQELAQATNNFGDDRLIGKGGFGKLYKGWLKNSNQIVAIKKFDRDGQQGTQVFLIDMLASSVFHHPNLVHMIGYCAEGDHRLSVYEYMPLGSLNDLLHDLRPDQSPLDWKTRMKIAAGISSGLEHLHEGANPPVIYRNLKCSKVLIDKEYRPALFNFGLAKFGPTDGEPFVSTRAIGTPGYMAPEYAMEGLASLAADVYSFGVVLLEIITGRKAIDFSRAPGKENIVAWVRPLLKSRESFPTMVDPVLQGRYPRRGLYQALAIAAMCIQENACMRPRLGDITRAIHYVASHEYEPEKEEIKA